MAYSAKAKLAVLKMHQENMSLREIEREFGIDRKEIKEWLRRYEKDGLTGLERKSYCHTTYEDRCAAVRDHLENGMSYAELTEKYDISRSLLKTMVAKVKTEGYESLHLHRRGRPSKSQNDYDKI